MKFNKQIKSYALISVVGVSSLFLQACSEEEVVAGVAIAAAAAVLTDDDRGYRDHDDRGYYDDDRGYYDDRGRWVEDRRYDGRRRDHRDHPGYGDGRGHYQPFAQLTDVSPESMQQFALNGVKAERNKVEIIASKYNLSTAAAEKLQDALNKAQVKDYSAIDQIGILRSDIENLYKNRNVTRYTLVNLSAAMGISFEDAKVFVSSYRKDIQTAKAMVK